MSLAIFECISPHVESIYNFLKIDFQKWGNLTTLVQNIQIISFVSSYHINYIT